MMKSFYYFGDSFLHRLNPLSKIIATAPLVLLALFATDPWTLAIFCLLFGSVTLILGRIPLKHYFKIVIPLLIFCFFFVVTYPFFVSVERVAETAIAFEAGPVTVYWGGIIFAIVIALRMCTIIMSALLFSLTTGFNKFVGALVQQWKVPYRIGYSTMAAYRFVPMLNFELAVIRAAHKIRGISDRGGLKTKFEQTKRYAVPLLSTAIRKAERTALAMDSRAFGAFEDRTYYHIHRFTRRDFLFILTLWLTGIAVVVILRQLGLFGPLMMFQML
ncbi:energy-coupling factor transporter transmembrane protein EcfT [Dehalococcoidia bacterium]|nr:energy-coupling factor transporter transmembrane protein EcfT [Dehalococcoidia bacterium]MCL0075766.1 energy-coupling factor transporter transmembrane protein EcfT [Dehalococcoidia bacterium]MCL0088717.1 energy-coupling factor transporter transmembrane protein EcfT [Dehalococcoidia bacterium]